MFDTFKVKSVTELTLGANADINDIKRLSWKTVNGEQTGVYMYSVHMINYVYIYNYHMYSVHMIIMYIFIIITYHSYTQTHYALHSSYSLVYSKVQSCYFYKCDCVCVNDNIIIIFSEVI